MAAADNIVYVNTTSNAVTLTLPAPTNGRMLQIKDSTGNAATHNITVNPHSTEKIDGASSLTLSDNYAFLSLRSDGTNWFTANAISITGNAATATALQTARTINGVSFNGTANITVTAAAGTLTGTTLNSTVTASSLTSVGTLSSLTVSGTATCNSVQVGSAANTIAGLASITCNSDRVTITGNTGNDTLVQLASLTNHNAAVYTRVNSASTTGAAYFVSQQDTGFKWSAGMDIVNTSNGYAIANTDGFGTSSSIHFQISTGGIVTIGAPSTTHQHSINTSTATTATAGSNGATPAQVSSYWVVTVNGTTQKIALYNA